MSVCERTVRHMHLLGSCSATFSNYFYSSLFCLRSGVHVL